MTDNDISTLFKNFPEEFDQDLQDLIQNRPLLSHYTSLHVLENIMKTGQLWFSNPLFMNDLEEMRFGFSEGMDIFLKSDDVDQACKSPDRAQTVRHAITHFYRLFDSEHAMDVYVFCLSEHDPNNSDGLLSMWRGYGSQGNGAALVFNTNFVKEPNPASPLIVGKVRYASREGRLSWLRTKLSRWCEIVSSSEIPTEKLYLAAYQFFQVIKLFALIFKHDGFSEEREWRIIYLPERDESGILKDRFDYVVGPRGVELKLKYNITPLPVGPSENWTFESILDRIILGPSISSPLARISVVRMLEKVGKSKFKEKVFPSTIPLRPAGL